MEPYYLFFCLRCGNVSPLKELRDDDPECPFCHFNMCYLYEDIPLQNYLQKGIYWSTIRKLIQENINKDAKVFNQELFDKREERDRILEENAAPLMQAFQNDIPQEPQYVPRCPTCGSPNIRDLGPVRLRGMYPEQRIGLKQFVCNNCGYEW